MMGVIRFYDFEGCENWIDVHSGELAHDPQGHVRANFMDRSTPLLKTRKAWALLTGGSTSREWSRYVLRLTSVVLGLKVRCVLMGDYFWATEIVEGLLNEFFPNLGERRLLELECGSLIEFVRPEVLKRIVEERKVLWEGESSRGLTAKFIGRSPKMEEHARFYEWDTWPDVLLALGKRSIPFFLYFFSTIIAVFLKL